MGGGVAKRRAKAKAGGVGYLREKRKRLALRKKFAPGGLIPNILEVKKNWDKKKSFGTNMKTSGLSKDPNIVLKQPGNAVQDNVANALAKIGNLPKLPAEKKQKKKTNDEDSRSKAIDLIEAKVADHIPIKTAVDLGQDWRLLCTYLMDRYKTDYNAMARDQRNYYQETPNQLRKKIILFVNNKVHFTEYCEKRNIPVDKLQFITADKVRQADKHRNHPYSC